MLFPPYLDPRKLAQKYRCPACDRLVCIDQKSCHHCNQAFSDVHRAEMGDAYRKNVREATPYVVLALAMVAAILYGLISYLIP